VGWLGAQVRGSIPRTATHSEVVQLARTSGSEPEGWGFDPSPQNHSKVAEWLRRLAVNQFYVGSIPTLGAMCEGPPINRGSFVVLVCSSRFTASLVERYEVNKDVRSPVTNLDGNRPVCYGGERRVGDRPSLVPVQATRAWSN
jgi:hypothetical protein